MIFTSQSFQKKCLNPKTRVFSHLYIGDNQPENMSVEMVLRSSKCASKTESAKMCVGDAFCVRDGPVRIKSDRRHANDQTRGDHWLPKHPYS